MKNPFLFICFLVLSSGTAYAQETLVFTGGNILTVDSGFTVATSMAIRGNRILVVGDTT